MFARLLARLRGTRAPLEVVLYTRVGCHLCDEMKAELGRARVTPPFRLVEIDVDTSPALQALHGRSVPVLAIGGRPAFKGRLTAAEFERKYARRARELRGGPGTGAARG